MTITKKQHLALIGLIVFAVAATFIVDLLIPLGVGAGVPYLVAVLFSIWLEVIIK